MSNNQFLFFWGVVASLFIPRFSFQKLSAQAKNLRTEPCLVFKAVQGSNHEFSTVLDTLKPKFYRLCFELNKENNDVLGLPISSSERKEIFVDFNTLDTAIVDIEEGKMIIYPSTKDTIYIKYQEQKRVITGAFIIPSYQEVRYAITYSPVTFMPTEIRPYFCYCPLRYGIWKYEINGKTKIIDYKIIMEPVVGFKSENA